MTKRIILHVGSPKCGSTYLQNVLKQNTKSLTRAGVYYPPSSEEHPGNGRRILNIQTDEIESWFSSETHTVVLSHEDLYSVPKLGAPFAQLAKALGIEIQAVAFLRPFNESVFGDYSQFMKQQFEHYLKTRQPYEGRDFNAFAQQRFQVLKPALFLKGWEMQSTSPIRLESHRAIRSTLEELLGPKALTSWEVPRNLTNPSLRTQDCDTIVEMLRNPKRSDSEIRRFFKAAFAPNQTPDLGRTAERISYIEKIFEPQTQALQKNFGFDNRIGAN